MRHRPLACLLLTLILTASPWLRGQTRYNIESRPGSGIRIEVLSAYDETPIKGYMPMRVTIENKSTGDKRWSFSSRYFRSRRNAKNVIFEWSTELSVGAGETRKFEIMAPILDTLRHGGYIRYRVNGPDVNDSFNSGTSGTNQLVSGAASPALERKSRNYKNAFRDKNRNRNFAALMKVGFWSADWRAYACLDYLWFQESDWIKMPPDVQEAIMLWVGQGGDMRLIKDKGTSDDAIIESLPGAGTGLIPYGLGNIRVFPHEYNQWITKYQPGKESPDAEKIIKALGSEFFSHAKAGGNSVIARSSGSINSIKESFEPIELNSTLVIIFMIGFAIVIGPANLWFFSRGRQRIRMYFTTPLIAIIASVLIAIFILFADGVGGEGKLTRIFVLLGDRNQEVILQNEYARTGLLLDRQFNPGEASMVRPLGSQLTGSGSYRLSGTYGIDNGQYWGAWFGSRRIQGVSMEQVRPSRSKFEIISIDNKPHVLSSFPGFCPKLYLIGQDGKTVYRAESVSTGKPTLLTKVDAAPMNIWLRKASDKLDDSLRNRLKKIKRRPSLLVASVEDYAGDAPSSLSSIHWSNYQSLVFAQAEGTEQLETGGAQ